MILNLLVNAIKFTINGYIMIFVRLNDNTSKIEISIRDTGIGVQT